jgi:stage II sporulation protein M
MDGLRSLIKGMHETTTNGTVGTRDNQLWYDFFIHNSLVNLFAMVSCLIPFLFIPVILMIFNAAVNGFAIGGLSLAYHFSFLKSFLGGIAPHGVLEYAVNILGFALGITLCKQMISGMKHKNIRTTMPYYIINSLRVYILVILPALLIAGIIESTITPLVINLII